MKTERKGDWFVTFSGKKFWPMDPRPEDFFIEDIAHALSNVCRFGGHVREFYSVAQHSIMVSDLSAYKACGLMHDATEAYMGDMVRPLKRSMPEFKKAESAMWFAIAERFSLPGTIPDDVKNADDAALLTERRDLLNKPYDHEWSMIRDGSLPIAKVIIPDSPADAEIKFLTAALMLGIS